MVKLSGKSSMYLRFRVRERKKMIHASDGDVDSERKYLSSFLIKRITVVDSFFDVI